MPLNDTVTAVDWGDSRLPALNRVVLKATAVQDAALAKKAPRGPKVPGAVRAPRQKEADQP